MGIEFRTYVRCDFAMGPQACPNDISVQADEKSLSEAAHPDVRVLLRVGMIYSEIGRAGWSTTDQGRFYCPHHTGRGGTPSAAPIPMVSGGQKLR